MPPRYRRSRVQFQAWRTAHLSARSRCATTRARPPACTCDCSSQDTRSEPAVSRLAYGLIEQPKRRTHCQHARQGGNPVGADRRTRRAQGGWRRRRLPLFPAPPADPSGSRGGFEASTGEAQVLHGREVTFERGFVRHRIGQSGLIFGTVPHDRLPEPSHGSRAPAAASH